MSSSECHDCVTMFPYDGDPAAIAPSMQRFCLLHLKQPSFTPTRSSHHPCRSPTFTPSFPSPTLRSRATPCPSHSFLPDPQFPSVCLSSPLEQFPFEPRRSLTSSRSCSSPTPRTPLCAAPARLAARCNRLSLRALGNKKCSAVQFPGALVRLCAQLRRSHGRSNIKDQRYQW